MFGHVLVGMGNLMHWEIGVLVLVAFVCTGAVYFMGRPSEVTPAGHPEPAAPTPHESHPTPSRPRLSGNAREQWEAKYRVIRPEDPAPVSPS